MKQFAVIGLGRFGLSVARILSEKGHQVLAIDILAEKVQEASSYVTQAVQVEITDEKGLRAVGIEHVDCAIVGIGGLEASILVTLTLKEIGISEIVSKAVNGLHGKVLQKVGATKVVFPERDMGIKLANSLVSPRIIEQIDLSSDYSIMETAVPREFTGSSLAQLGVRAKYGITIIAIRRKEPVVTEEGKSEVRESVNILPEANYIIKEDDVLIIIGSNKDIEKLKKKG
ncbi:MAG: TrkA family potassium uptake protein [Candidatus Omnitrophota bacterium]|nr:TrkA family potassium uptake protein [Candidatus Omnitrophota bacterium]